MTTPDLPSSTKRSWHRFLETYEPLRSDLYRYCRYLTRNPWDAEDLAQDALARAFVTLARMEREPTNPRAWLFRVASNLWIDQLLASPRGRPTPCPIPRSRCTDGFTCAPRGRRDAPRQAVSPGAGGGRPQGRVRLLARGGPPRRSVPPSVESRRKALHRGQRKLIDEGVPKTATVHCRCRVRLDESLHRVQHGRSRSADGTAAQVDSAAVEVGRRCDRVRPEAARNTILTGLMFGSRFARRSRGADRGRGELQRRSARRPAVL